MGIPVSILNAVLPLVFKKTMITKTKVGEEEEEEEGKEELQNQRGRISRK